MPIRRVERQGVSLGSVYLFQKLGPEIPAKTNEKPTLIILSQRPAVVGWDTYEVIARFTDPDGLDLFHGINGIPFDRPFIHLEGDQINSHHDTKGYLWYVNEQTKASLVADMQKAA